ncbi:MAG: flagellar basal-body MS-ring/collar protein FliF [Pseudomonadota bacterium]
MDASSFESSNNRQLRIIAIVLAVLIVLLALCYFAFLRLNLSVLYSGVQPAFASEIISELDAREVQYRVEDGGNTILVPARKADEIRLAIEGERSPLNQIVGFELFNESDMGLTDFAQRIKYQRALEGELARTIMLIDGIEQARVHISMPERALFRADRIAPKAAVSIIAAPNFLPGRARILGIQKLVAAAVPHLSISDVVILNDAGETISAREEADLAIADPGSQTGDQRLRHIRQLAERAIETTFIGLEFSILISESDGDASLGESEEGFRRTKLTILTDIPLTLVEQEIISDLLSEGAGFDAKNGDILSFRERVVPAAQQVIEPSDGASGESGGKIALLTSIFASISGLAWGVGCASVLLLIVLISIAARRMRGSLSPEERAAFANQLKLELAPVEPR